MTYPGTLLLHIYLLQIMAMASNQGGQQGVQDQDQQVLGQENVAPDAPGEGNQALEAVPQIQGLHQQDVAVGPVPPAVQGECSSELEYLVVSVCDRQYSLV